MQRENILREKVGSESGFKVPEGYFEELNVRIMANLPAYPEAPKAHNISAWQRFKPYLYLAAMFAGIWVMMKVFYNVSMSDSLSFDNPPEAIVQALQSDPHEMDMIYLPSTLDDIQLEEEVSAGYDSMSEFEKDFASF